MMTKDNPGTRQEWSASSWKKAPKKSPMIPEYFQDSFFIHTQATLRKSAPLIFAEEARQLKDQLAQASVGKAFVLIGGDCAETFEDSNIMKLWNDFSLFLKLSLLLTFGIEMPIVKIGRIAGQYAKPRSEILETRGNYTLPSYQGDIINSMQFSKRHRVPNPTRMMNAYHLSTQSLNILRAFIQGGYTDIFNHESWSLFHTISEPVQVMYNEILDQLKKSLRFMKALKVDSKYQKNLRDISFFVGHEALLLPYEECLVRNDSITNKPYGCSAHFLWIGERTRELDGPHVEFCRGISNPIGIKVSQNTSPEDLLELTRVLNPTNEHGRLTIITRMGYQQLETCLPRMIEILKSHDRHVVWMCDPMHANTQTVYDKSTDSYRKTRYFLDIWKEIMVFFEIHWKMHSIPAGIHLEMTGQNVTECMGGYVDPVTDLIEFKSAMDPRLNPTQAIEIMLLLCQLFRSYHKTKEFVTTNFLSSYSSKNTSTEI